MRCMRESRVVRLRPSMAATPRDGGHDAVALAEGFAGLVVGIRIHGADGLRRCGRRADLLLALGNGRNRGGNLQRADIQAGAAGKNDRALDNVGKLAHVAGPGLVAEPAQGGGRNIGDVFLHLPRHLLRKMLCQQGDVFAAFAQRRNGDGKDVKPVEQIIPERSVEHHFLQIAVGSRYQAHIHGNDLVPAKAFNFARLQYAQQFGLQFQRDVAPCVARRHR